MPYRDPEKRSQYQREYKRLQRAGECQTPGQTLIPAPLRLARQALEDLTVHGIASRRSGGKGNPDAWRLTAWARQQRETASVYENYITHTIDGGSYTPSVETQNLGGRVSVKGPPTSGIVDDGAREDHCWKCKQPVGEESNGTCERCGWLICTCGACAKGCEGAEELPLDGLSVTTPPRVEPVPHTCVDCGAETTNTYRCDGCIAKATPP